MRYANPRTHSLTHSLLLTDKPVKQEKHGGARRQEAQLSPEGPRDALFQLKSCQLPRNRAETTCTTSPQQIEVMKLEGYGGPMRATLRSEPTTR